MWRWSASMVKGIPRQGCLMTLPKVGTVHTRNLSFLSTAATNNTVRGRSEATRTTTSFGCVQFPPAVSRRWFSLYYDFDAQSFRAIQGIPYTRAFPQYNLYGETCAMQVRPIAATYRAIGQGQDSLVVDRRGRIFVDFFPFDARKRRERANYPWVQNYDDEQEGGKPILFAISTTEVGLLIRRLSASSGGSFELTRTSPADINNYNPSAPREKSQASLTKSLTGEPMEDGSFHFVAQTYEDDSGRSDAMLEIHLQPGEVEVLQSLLRFTLPHLLGFETLLRAASLKALKTASSELSPEY